MRFSVKSEPPLSLDTLHTLTHRDGHAAPHRFKVEQNVIIFHNVNIGDPGDYTISCTKKAGLEGRKTFELKVLQGR